MKLRRTCGLLFAFAVACWAVSAWATIETTSPVWVATATTLSGNGGSGAKYTTFSQRMIRPILYAGTISTVQGSTITDTNAAWTNGEFGTNGIVSYIEFDNGWMADISTSTASNSSLSLAGNVSSIVSAGNAYRVRAHFTIASIFGTNNETGLRPGLNPSTADNIIVQVPQTQQTLTIFYFTNSAGGSWREANYAVANNLVIYPEQGLLVRRISVGNTALYLTGQVKTTATVAPVDPGYNLLGTLQSVTNQTLAALNLYTGNPTTGVAGGLNPSVSDTLLILQPDGSTSTYFYFTGSSPGWRSAAFVPAGSVQIPAGGAFYIHRLSANGPFDWTIPAD